MIDILKSIAGGGWAWLVSWLFPSLIAVSAFGLLILPSQSALPILKELAETSSGNQVATLLGAALLTALLLAALSTVLYRILEGYVLIPRALRTTMTNRQQRTRNDLKVQADELRSSAPTGAPRLDTPGETVAPDEGTTAGSGIEYGLLSERLRQFPVEDTQLGPTRFANALRALETYAFNRYQLDSQLLWNELVSVVPDSLRQEESNARASVNFFVSLVYLSVALAVLSVVTLVSQGWSASVVVACVLSVLLTPVWYRLAVISVHPWNAVVQAIVNVGRKDLADKLGLVLPRSIAREREMWQLVSWLVIESYDEYWASRLDRFRPRKD